MSASLVSHLRSLARAFFLSDEFELAFLVHRQTVHWSARAWVAPHEPHSAVTDLVQALFQRLQDQSFFVLRERIYTTAPATDFDRALVKVTAKRLTDHVLLKPEIFDVQPVTHLTFVHESPEPVAPTPFALTAYWPGTAPRTDEDWLKLCSRLAGSIERGQVLHRYHRPLAALIVSEDGRVLSAATHHGAVDKTQHAELRAVQNWFAQRKSGLPDGSRVYASLKPCRMCAAALAHASAAPEKLKIIYLDDDPGTHARHTLLTAQAEQKSASALTVLEGETEAFLNSIPRRSYTRLYA